eukprot:scaffold96135_cov57-Phaeocystis_antarctica.AAC.3
MQSAPRAASSSSSSGATKTSHPSSGALLSASGLHHSQLARIPSARSPCVVPSPSLAGPITLPKVESPVADGPKAPSTRGLHGVPQRSARLTRCLVETLDHLGPGGDVLPREGLVGGGDLAAEVRCDLRRHLHLGAREIGHAAGLVKGADEPGERVHRWRDGVAVVRAARGHQRADRGIERFRLLRGDAQALVERAGLCVHTLCGLCAAQQADDDAHERGEAPEAAAAARLPLVLAAVRRARRRAAAVRAAPRDPQRKQAQQEQRRHDEAWHDEAEDLLEVRPHLVLHLRVVRPAALEAPADDRLQHGRGLSEAAVAHVRMDEELRRGQRLARLVDPLGRRPVGRAHCLERVRAVSPSVSARRPSRAKNPTLKSGGVGKLFSVTKGENWLGCVGASSATSWTKPHAGGRGDGRCRGGAQGRDTHRGALGPWLGGGT